MPHSNPRPTAFTVLLSAIDRFRHDSRGSIAIIFGLTFVIMIAAVGASVDFGRWLSASSETRSTVDAAVLAAGRVLQLPDASPAAAVAVAQTYFDSHKSKYIDSGTVTFTVGDSGTSVLAASTAKVKTPFMAVVGTPELPITIRAKAMLQVGANSGTNVEVSMMLDITGSMLGDKLESLKLAATDLIDIVVWADQSTYTSRVAIVPFSEHVNVGRDYFKAVTGNNIGGNNNPYACVRERSNADRYTDAAPAKNNYFDQGPTNFFCRPGATIVPLTNDKTKLKTEINSFVAAGGTAGHLGTAWAWYMLSPNWTSVWPNNSDPRPYAELSQIGPKGQPVLRKIAVLMTDGEYNTWYSGSSSTTQAREICSNMKAKGIEVYTIGFGITAGGESETTLKECASGVGNFYNAADSDSLRMAFRDVALKIATLRLTE